MTCSNRSIPTPDHQPYLSGCKNTPTHATQTTPACQRAPQFPSPGKSLHYIQPSALRTRRARRPPPTMRSAALPRRCRGRGATAAQHPKHRCRLEGSDNRRIAVGQLGQQKRGEGKIRSHKSVSRGTYTYIHVLGALRNTPHSARTLLRGRFSYARTHMRMCIHGHMCICTPM